MTVNEKRARDYISVCIVHGHGPVDLMGDIILTDKECRSIAINYPFRYQDIRNAFPDNKDEIFMGLIKRIFRG